MSRIFWDTNLFIYLWEDYRDLSKQVVALRSKMLARGDELLTSTFTLGEILVKPTMQGNTALCKQYEKAIRSVALLIPFEIRVAETYATVRCDRSIKAPDAIQLASAASVGTDLFITHDTHLHGKHVAGIQFIAPLDRVPI